MAEQSGLILLVVGIILAAVAIRVFWLSFHVHRPGQNWLTVEGVVYVCRIHILRDSNGEERSEPRIKCLYRVNGAAYNLTLDDPGYWTCTQQEWENVSRYYPSVFTAIVRYDPNNPRRALVEPIVKLNSQ